MTETTTQTDVPAEPFLVPLNAIFADDFTELLIPVFSTDTMTEVAAKVGHHVLNKRVAARDAALVVWHEGRRLSADETVLGAGIAPLDHVRVDFDE